MPSWFQEILQKLCEEDPRLYNRPQHRPGWHPPQAASKLLLKCLAPAPGYLSQVCHPNVTKKPLQDFDKTLWKLWCTILGGIGSESEQLTMCSTGQERAQKWAQLPARLGGAGLNCWSTIADYAWFCSVAACGALQDVNFEIGRVFLREECENAHAVALNALGGPTMSTTRTRRFSRPKNPMSCTILISRRDPNYKKNSIK